MSPRKVIIDHRQTVGQSMVFEQQSASPKVGQEPIEKRLKDGEEHLWRRGRRIDFHILCSWHKSWGGCFGRSDYQLQEGRTMGNEDAEQ